MAETWRAVHTPLFQLALQETYSAACSTELRPCSLCHWLHVRCSALTLTRLCSLTKALNPLDPCGACMEWLRKIAEVNPDFKVITFSDTTCDSAIITPIDYLTV